MKPCGNLYSIESEDLLVDIQKAYDHFVKKYGHAPEFISIRAHHCTEHNLKRSAVQKIGLLDVVVERKNFPIGHFMLFPVMKKTPRILSIERKPCLQ